MLKPELSEKNQYWIPRLRYYELKNFVLQYNDWLRQYKDTYNSALRRAALIKHEDDGTVNDPVSMCVEAMMHWSNRMGAVEKAVKETTPIQSLQCLIFEAVIHDKSYATMELENDVMPVSRAEWYNLYRKFFWILDKIRE